VDPREKQEQSHLFRREGESGSNQMKVVYWDRAREDVL